MPHTKDELERLKVLAENLTREDMAALNVMFTTLDEYTLSAHPITCNHTRIEKYLESVLRRKDWREAASNFDQLNFDPTLPPKD